MCDAASPEDASAPAHDDAAQDRVARPDHDAAPQPPRDAQTGDTAFDADPGADAASMHDARGTADAVVSHDAHTPTDVAPVRDGTVADSASTAGWPGASNTGVPAGTTLTPMVGDVAITTNGTVIDGRDVHGTLTVQASHVTIRRSRIHGNGYWIVRLVQGFTGLTLEDTEITRDNRCSGTGESHPECLVTMACRSTATRPRSPGWTSTTSRRASIWARRT